MADVLRINKDTAKRVSEEVWRGKSERLSPSVILCYTVESIDLGSRRHTSHDPGRALGSVIT